MILFAITVFGLFAGYFYYSQVLQDKTLPITTVNVPVDDNFVKLKQLKLDFSGLDNLTFKTLKIFGESPVQPGLTGRVDVFAPY